jgi:hypothetical protein
LMATLLSSAAGAVAGAGAKAGGAVVGSAVTMAGAGTAAAAGAGSQQAGVNPVSYYVDAMLRADANKPATGTQADRTAEVTRILSHSLQSGELGAEDRQYLAQLVAADTGLSQADAEKRVNDTYANLVRSLQQARDKAKQVADDARKASAWLALWLVVSLFVGAFIAALCATFGGRLRDSAHLTTP